MIRPKSATKNLTNLGMMLTFVAFASLFPLLPQVLMVLYFIAYKLMRIPYFMAFIFFDAVISLNSYIWLSGFLPLYGQVMETAPSAATAVVESVKSPALNLVYGFGLLGFDALMLGSIYFLWVRPQVHLYRKLKAYMS